MPTEVITTLDPGGTKDFTTLAAALASREGDIVTRDTIEIFECYNTGTGSLGTCQITEANWTTGPNNYIVIRAAEEAKHPGKWVTENTARWSQLDVRARYVRLEDMQGHSGNTLIIQPGGSECDIRVDRCILSGNGGVNISCDIRKAPGTVRIRSTQMFNADIGLQIGGTFRNLPDVRVYNCNMMGATAALRVISSDSISAVLNNNYYWRVGPNNPALLNNGVTLGANDATDNGQAPTAALRNIALSSTNFVAPADTGFTNDMHLASGSSLLLVGADIAEVTFDIDGAARPTGFFDIGQDQLSTAPVDDPDAQFPQRAISPQSGSLGRKHHLEINNALFAERLRGTGTLEYVILFREVPNE